MIRDTYKIMQFILDKVLSASLKKYNDDPYPTYVNSDRFMFAVRIDDLNFLNKPLFNVTMETRDYETLANGTKIKNKYQIPLEPCTINHWKNLPSYGTNWTNVFEKSHFSGFLCPKINQEFILGGSYNSQHFYHWKFQVSKCKNNITSDSLWKPKCATDEEIEKFFKENKNIRFEVMINNFVLNPLESSNYVNAFAEDTIFFSIQRNGAYQTADIYLTENIVQTDESILPFKQIKEEKYLIYQFGNFRQQYVIGQVEDVYAEFYFRKDSFSFDITRKFEKISEIISYIGGFSQIFILICSILVNYYNDYIYTISLANKIYDFEQENLNQKKKSSNTSLNNKTTNHISDKNTEFKFDTPQVNTSLGPLPFCQIDIQQNKLVGEQLNDDQLQQQLTPNKYMNRRITAREENGLMPLDVLKSIIQQRKSFLQSSEERAQQQRIIQCIQQKNEENFCNNIDNQSTKVEKIDEEFVKQSQYNPHLKVDSLSVNNDSLNSKEESENQLKNLNQRKKVSALTIFQNVQNSSNKIQCKNITTDYINPESPNKIKQNPIKISSIQNKNENKEFSVYLSLTQEEQKGEKIIQKQNNNKIPDFKSNYTYDFEINRQSKSQQIKRIEKEQLNIENNNEQNNINNNLQKKTEKCLVQKPQLEIKTKIEQQQDFMSLENININSNFALYDMQENTQDKNNTFQNEDTKQLTQINKILFEGLGFQNQKQFLNKEFEYILKKDTAIKMTYKFFLYKLTCGRFFRTEQVLLLDKANKQMKKELDIFMILNKLKELEKLKSLFLDKNQQILFNFFPKPIITVKEINKNLSRAEITEEIKSRNDLSSLKIIKNIKVNQKQQNKLNINLKIATIVSKAANQFKKPLTEKVNEFDNLVAYQKLFDAYQYVKAQDETTIFLY